MKNEETKKSNDDSRQDSNLCLKVRKIMIKKIEKKTTSTKKRIKI